MEYRAFGCLPFLHLETEKPIELGSALFVPANRCKEFVGEEYEKLLLAHLNKHDLVSEKVTCIAFKKECTEDEIIPFMVDAIYLLYFILASKGIYYNFDIPALQPFTKLIPANQQYLSALDEVDFKPMQAVYGTSTFAIGDYEHELSQGFHQALAKAHEPESEQSHSMQCLIRSIRYFIDGFMHPFENVASEGFEISQSIFDPEIIIFLMTSFETLFGIEGKSSSSDLKQTFRPMLHLKFSRSVETLWKWVDGFYELHQHIVHGGELPDDTFTKNESLSLSYLHIGIKMFIYSAIYRMYERELVKPVEHIQGYPPLFENIAAEEVLIFFWTEDDILRKLSIVMMQLSEGNYKEEYEQDVYHLAKLYLLYPEKYAKGQTNSVEYHEHKPESLANYKKAILNLSGESFSKENEQIKIGTLFPEQFLKTLKGS